MIFLVQLIRMGETPVHSSNVMSLFIPQVKYLLPNLRPLSSQRYFLHIHLERVLFSRIFRQLWVYFKILFWRHVMPIERARVADVSILHLEVLCVTLLIKLAVEFLHESSLWTHHLFLAKIIVAVCHDCFRKLQVDLRLHASCFLRVESSLLWETLLLFLKNQVALVILQPRKYKLIRQFLWSCRNATNSFLLRALASDFTRNGWTWSNIVTMWVDILIFSSLLNVFKSLEFKV